MDTATNRSRRRTVAKFSLAGIAVLGIGAAVTSAAWTDDVWFTADAEAATFDLQGALDEAGPWEDVGVDATPNDDTDDVAIQIPATEFGDIIPGFDNTVTLWLLNAGTSDITLAAPAETLTGVIFSGAAPADVTIGALGTTTLAPGATTSFTVQLTTPDDWPVTYQGTSGTIDVVVVGTAS